MENKKIPSWLNRKKQMFKTAATMSGGVTLSKDTKDWPDEIIDHIHDKFPFLKKYSIVLNIDKKDKDTLSAMMYGVVVLGEGRKISIVIAVSNGKLLPVFVFVYKGKYYPLIEEVLEDISNEDLELGSIDDSEEDFGQKKTPWSAMLDFLQNSVFDKRASIINGLESEQNMDILPTLMTNEKIAMLMNTLVKETPVRHVKTASHRNGLYKEMIDGSITQIKNVMLDTHVSSNRVKTAEINEAIASETDRIIHYTNDPLTKEGMIIKGEKKIPLIKGKVFKIQFGDKTIDVKCIGKGYPGTLFYNKEKGLFSAITNSNEFELSDTKIDAPPMHEITGDDAGKMIFSAKGADEISVIGILKTFVEDEGEIIYIIGDDKYVYSPGFSSGYRNDTHYIGHKLVGYATQANEIISNTVNKTASDVGTHIRLERADVNEGDNTTEDYQLDISTTGKDTGSVIFPKKSTELEAATTNKEEAADSVKGDKVDVEHRLVQEGLTQSSIKQLTDEADNEGSAVMFIKEEKLIEKEPSEEAIKTAASIQETVREYLSFDKIASFINNDNISDVFSLHFLSKENVAQFMEEVPRIEGVIDHLSRYYVLRTVGLSSDSDMIDTKSLEKLLMGLYRVLRDLRKYKAITVG